jgi:hypothetical protein
MDVMEWEIKGTSPEYLAIIEDIQNIDRTYRKNLLIEEGERTVPRTVFKEVSAKVMKGLI